MPIPSFIKTPINWLFCQEVTNRHLAGDLGLGSPAGLMVQSSLTAVSYLVGKSNIMRYIHKAVEMAYKFLRNHIRSFHIAPNRLFPTDKSVFDGVSIVSLPEISKEKKLQLEKSFSPDVKKAIEGIETFTSILKKQKGKVTISGTIEGNMPAKEKFKAAQYIASQLQYKTHALDIDSIFPAKEIISGADMLRQKTTESVASNTRVFEEAIQYGEIPMAFGGIVVPFASRMAMIEDYFQNLKASLKKEPKSMLIIPGFERVAAAKHFPEEVAANESELIRANILNNFLELTENLNTHGSDETIIVGIIADNVEIEPSLVRDKRMGSFRINYNDKETFF